MNIQAYDKSVFQQILSQVDVSVSKLTESRNKDQRERHNMSHLLSALAHNDMLEYPLKVKSSERPDFLMNMAGKSVGIEVREATNENETVKNIIIETEWKNGTGKTCYPVSLARSGERFKGKKKLQEELNIKHSPGIVGDSAEKNWSKAMMSFIDEKINTLLKDGFQRCQEDWLLIYDNWPSTVYFNDYGPGMKYLLDEIKAYSGKMEFHQIFILGSCCSKVCCLKDGEYEILPVINHWKTINKGKPSRSENIT